MSLCKFSGAEIDWIHTENGQFVPIDPEPVCVIEDGRKDEFIDDMGAVIYGRVAHPEEESIDLPFGFIQHQKTCKNHPNFQRRGRG